PTVALSSCAGSRWASTSVAFFFRAEEGIRDRHVTGVQTCALPISYYQIHQERRHRQTVSELARQAVTALLVDLVIRHRERGHRADRADPRGQVAVILRHCITLRTVRRASLTCASC